MDDVHPLIRLHDLTKQYRSSTLSYDALRGINLNIYKGEFVAIMGPSGAGKTTLLNVIGLLDKPSTGSYQLDGEEITHKSEKKLSRLRRDGFGFVFQTANLLPKFSLVQNVEMPMLYRRIGHRESRKYAVGILNQLGLADKLKNKPSQLSAGQLQRGAIARALIQSPKIILADEPTGNLDTASSIEIMNIFKGLNNRGMTIILVTHSQDVANYAHRILYVRDGQLVGSL